MNTIELELISKSITDYNGSEESLKSIFISLSDYFSKLKYNLKANLTRKDGKFYSSELVVFQNQNKARIRDFFKNKKYAQFGHIEVEIPNGFKSDFSSCIIDINKLNQRLDLDVTITSSAGIIKQISESGTTNKVISEMIRITRSNRKVTSSDMRTFHNHHFENKSSKIKAKPASDVYGTFDKVKFIFDDLLKFDIEYRNAEKIYDKLENIDKSLDTLIPKIENKLLTMSKSDIRILYGLISFLSEQVNAYSILLETIQKLEHNFCIGFKRLIRIV